MNFFKKMLLIICLVNFISVQSETIEIQNMEEIHQYLQPDTFIVFDIDNTLIEPIQELGTDQWFYLQLASYLENGMLFKAALSKALAEWHAIQFLTKVNIVEKGSDEIVFDLQNKGFKIIGLTTRGFVMSHCTRDQLESVKIDLSINSPVDTHYFFQNGDREVLFHKGILYTQASHKGNAFFTLLEKMNYRPAHIVFINDKATHIREIEEICEEKNIPFIGLRYGFLDEKVKNFKKHLADIQYKKFGRILTDEEALLINNQ